MEKIQNLQNSSLTINEEELNKEIEKLLQSLPREYGWDENFLCHYNGIWWPHTFIPGVVRFQRHFEAQASDIILATHPKSGTTWLKALLFSIVNRHKYTSKTTPLLTTPPHQLVRFVDVDHYFNGIPDYLDQLPKPRIFATHINYHSLPQSVRDCPNCRVVYLCRNPMDNFLSHWKFLNSVVKEIGGGPILPLEEAFEKYCQGVYSFGPFWDNALEYWKMSLENPKKVLFMKFEDLKGDEVSEIKRLAEFLGCPITAEEGKEGMVEEISRLCSFENLRNLEVNQNGEYSNLFGIPVGVFFRKGEVGDYVNHLLPSMVETMENITKEKFAGSGLDLNVSTRSSKN